MNDNSSYVLGLIALIMVSVSCVFFVFYRAGGGRESRSKTVRYAGCLGKLLFAASVILLSVSILNGFAKGEGFRENLVRRRAPSVPDANANPTPWLSDAMAVRNRPTHWPRAIPVSATDPPIPPIGGGPLAGFVPCSCDDGNPGCLCPSGGIPKMEGFRENLDDAAAAFGMVRPIPDTGPFGHSRAPLDLDISNGDGGKCNIPGMAWGCTPGTFAVANCKEMCTGKGGRYDAGSPNCMEACIGARTKECANPSGKPPQNSYYNENAKVAGVAGQCQKLPQECLACAAAQAALNACNTPGTGQGKCPPFSPTGEGFRENYCHCYGWDGNNYNQCITSPATCYNCLHGPNASSPGYDCSTYNTSTGVRAGD